VRAVKCGRTLGAYAENLVGVVELVVMSASKEIGELNKDRLLSQQMSDPCISLCYAKFLSCVP